MRDLACPMKFNPHTLDRDGELAADGCQCQHDGCAWWNKDSDQCAVLDIAFILRNDTISIAGSVDIPEPVQILTR